MSSQTTIGQATRARASAKTARVDIRAWLVAALRGLPTAACFFALTLAECFAIPSPFACCAFAAVLQANLPLTAPVCGLTAGLIMRLVWGVAPDVWQFVGCLAVYFALRLLPLRNVSASLAVFAALMPRMLFSLVLGDAASVVIYAALSAGLGAACYPAFYRACAFLRDRSQHKFSQDALCLMLFSLALLVGVGRIALSWLRLGDALSGALVLLVSTVAPGGAAACAGLLCGLSLTLSGQPGLTMLSLAFSGMFCGLLRPRGRWMTAAGYLLSCLFASYLMGGSLDIARIVSGAAACTLFLSIPQRRVRVARMYAQALKPVDPTMESAYVESRLKSWSGGMTALADALPEVLIREPPLDEQTEVLADRLCAGCENLPICWHERFDENKATFGALLQGASDAALPEDCLRVTALPACLAANESRMQEIQLKKIYAQTERDMTRATLCAISQAVERLAAVSCRQADEDALLQMDVEGHMADTLRYRGKLRYAKRVEGHVVLEIERDPFGSHSPARLARELGLLMHMPLQAETLPGNRILLEEQPPLSALCGSATACAFDLATSGRHNGDASLVKPLPGGRLCLALSDGMGHGAQAAGESKKTLELLTRCLETGFSCEQALTTVNGMMLSATNGEQYATVDLCVLDLWTRSATLYKLGACATLVVQNGSMRRVSGATLPLGALANVLPLRQTLTVYPGDLVLLMSDGLSDVLSSDDIERILCQIAHENPQALCDALLREALAREGGKPRDDITVVCARIVQD